MSFEMVVKLLNRLVLSGVIVMTMSCEEESLESAGTLSEPNAQSSIEDLVFLMHTDIVSMIESEGTKSLTQLIDLISVDDEFTGRIEGNGALGSVSRDQMTQRFENLVNVFIPTKKVGFVSSDSDEFDFEANLGVYVWDFEMEEFIKTDEAIDHIIVRFPSVDSDSNNASLQILSYDQEQDETNEEDALAVPILIVANLIVDDVLHASLNFDVERDEEFMIDGAKAVLFVAPFDYTLEYKFLNQTSSQCNTSVTRDNVKFIDNSFKADFDSAEQDEVIKIEGYISYSAYSIAGSIDVMGLQNAVVDEDINTYVDLVFSNNGNKIGDIFLQETEDSEGYDPYILFEDGTLESLESKFQPILDELEEFIMEIEGEV